MMTLLCEIKAQVRRRGESSGQSRLHRQLHEFEERYQTILMAGFKANPPPPIDERAPKKEVAENNRLRRTYSTG